MFGLILVAASPLVSADIPSQQAIDRFCLDQVKQMRTPSASVAVVKEGKVIFAKAYGLAEMENDVRATPHHVYRLGSITKQFTATMIMQLVSEGKLKLDDSARKHLPELPESWKDVTVRHLLNHTSGIKSYTELPGLFQGDAMKPTTPIGIVKKVFDIPLESTPGSKYHYNNTGYEILGMLIEKLDARTYAVSLKTRILDPLGMKETYFTSESAVVKKRTQGYSWDGKQYRRAQYLNMDWPYAAGSMESTVFDLAKWDAALYGNLVLPQETLKQMWTPARLTDGKTNDYGFGWALGSVKGASLVEHGGGIHGFTSYIRRAPSKKLTTIVLVNSDSASADQLAVRLMGYVDSELKVEPPKPIIDRDPEFTKKVRRLVESITEGKPETLLLTEKLQKRLTPEIVAEAREQLSLLGKLEKIELSGDTKEESGRRLTYSGKFGENTIRFVFLVLPSGLIDEIGIRP